jgi:hypothetical protein
MARDAEAGAFDTRTCWLAKTCYLDECGAQARRAPNAMLIGAAEAHIELELATLDEAAEAILTTLSSRSNG